MQRLTKSLLLGLVVVGTIFVQLACQQTTAQQNPASCTPVLAVSPDKVSFTATAGGDTVFQQTITIINKGTGDLNWAVSDNSPWIVVQQFTGTTSSSGSGVNIVVNAAGLAAGSYTGIVMVTSAGALNSPVYVPVFLNVPQGAAGPPPAVQQPATTTAPVSTSSNPPPESAAAWNNQTQLYRYADSYSCIVSGSVTNTDAIWYMGNVQIISKSGSTADIADTIPPGEQIIYRRFIPCYDNEQVRLSYQWYRP